MINHQKASLHETGLHKAGLHKAGLHKAGLANPSATIWLSELLAGYAEVEQGHDCLIAALQLSSQRVGSGDMFIALPGMITDGRAYIDQALANGAAAVLFEKIGASRSALLKDSVKQDALVIGIENLQQKLGIIAARYFGNPSKNLKMIGITGTNGKTTTAYLIAQALELLGIRCGYSGTIGSGFVSDLQHSELTTMDAISIHEQLFEFLANQAGAVSMEVSSHGLEQGRANGIDFDIAIFTNLTQDHLDYHQSMTRYGDAKQKLFEFASLNAVVINSDDNFGRELLQLCNWRGQGLTCVSYGMKSGELQPVELETDDQGIRFKLAFQGQRSRQQIHSRLLGEVNVPNILAAIGCLFAMGYAMGAIAEVVAHIAAPPGRMEVFSNRPAQPAVVVDYAHTPDALERALKSLKSLCRGNLVVVFGCGGDRDQDKRAQMGRIAQSIADRIIVTDDNPRTEPSAQIIEQIKQGLSQPITVIHDRRQAMAEAIKSSNQDDLILLAGKGHEHTQTIGNAVNPLSDRAMVPELLEELT
ncbi:UDP-N-acetylmuramoyl-L-alanyl-D-glutamate--2,6-diaminopimelate ligase [Candidatus Spongiihabitans sp.]|uniref:UDP-N-acetylmuramoyl-L-alanyl-D-glutamate--2, 6-diaminopimelate ligase n=1 Tax=Candidatus Spongiihabitans sp. TaxID=3101308 RepID=UPI003C6FE178